MYQLQPNVEEALRPRSSRASKYPEAQEVGAIECEFRDAGLNRDKPNSRRITRPDLTYVD